MKSHRGTNPLLIPSNLEGGMSGTVVHGLLKFNLNFRTAIGGLSTALRKDNFSCFYFMGLVSLFLSFFRCLPFFFCFLPPFGSGLYSGVNLIGAIRY
jgi:hypothetical protein